MPKIRYIKKKFQAKTQKTIDDAINLLLLYESQGFIVSLRQLYYRLLSTGKIPTNTVREYKRLVNIMSEARLDGQVDWDFLEDRGRGLDTRQHWNSPESIVRACAAGYGINLWVGQKYMVECWFEKDALKGVFAPVCEEWDVPYFSCHGYSSQSEMWKAGQRLQGYIRRDMTPVILYLGDHDPSGIQMTEDISARMEMFCRQPVEVDRLALTMAQVKEFNPISNYAKETDSRYDRYVAAFGVECWELDALEPRVLAELVQKAVQKRLSRTAFAARMAQQESERGDLELLSEYYDAALVAAEDAEGEEETEEE